MKLTKKAKRAVRQQVYRLIAEALRGEHGQAIAKAVYDKLPDTTEAIVAVNVREYAVSIVQNAANGYDSLIGSLDIANAILPDKNGPDGTTYDHPDTPPAHHPDTGADA